jgi:hypothetical protein
MRTTIFWKRYCVTAEPVTHEVNTMTPQPLTTVHDVEFSSRWYQSVLGLQSRHGGAEYERLFPRDVSRRNVRDCACFI